MHAVSGSIALPFRGSFRLSLTVLVHYRSITSISPWRMVPPSSDRITRVPPYLSYPQFHFRLFTYGAVTHCGCPFQDIPLRRKLKGTGCSHFARHYSGNLG